MSYVDQISIEKELLLEFLMKFSRFEFALKHAGYVRGDGNCVEPDWKRFSADIDNLFNKDNTPMLARACEYFLINPPYHQVLISGALGWSGCLPRKANTETELLIDLVKRVRDNICHGGEYNERLHKESALSEAFLRGSLLIIDECLRGSPGVSRAFTGKIL